MDSEKKYTGRGGWHGGGRPKKGDEAKRKTVSISGSPAEIQKLKDLAKSQNKTVSRFILDNEDCLEAMKRIPDGSVDMILTDPPYGTTACKWDSVIPFEPMWEQLNRIIKNNGAIVLFSSQPFTSLLCSSNIKNYKYDWIWDKVSVSNPQLAKVQPLKNFEIISVFGKNKEKVLYFPQGLIKLNIDKQKSCVTNRKVVSQTEKLCHIKRRADYVQEFTNYPKALCLRYSRPSNSEHPTQKPVALLEYLIKTYTREDETVLDFTMGSGSTGVACINTNRQFIGIELDQNYFKIASERIAAAEKEKNQLLFTNA